MQHELLAFTGKSRGAIQKFLKDNESLIVANLREMVECNTFSSNKAGLDKIQKIIKNFMPAGYTLSVDRQHEAGDNYVYRYLCPGEKNIALHGHLDTLCPDDENFNTIRDDGTRIYGPGTHDMKGGILVLIWTLKALEHLRLLDRMSFTVIFNTDEETGSNCSRRLFYDLAKEKSVLAIKFEGGELANTVVTTRKGMAKFTLTARGKSQHFGNLKSEKLNAIKEIAGKILFIENLNSDKIAANVGRVEGGIASNVVPETAAIDFEVRSRDLASLDECIKLINGECVKSSQPGIDLSLEQTTYIQPWNPCAKSREVFELICEIAGEMGQQIVEEKRGGISDSNHTAAAGIPAIDGLGPIGTGDCTPDEFIVKQSIFDRIELATGLLLKYLKR